DRVHREGEAGAGDGAVDGEAGAGGGLDLGGAGEGDGAAPGVGAGTGLQRAGAVVVVSRAGDLEGLVADGDVVELELAAGKHLRAAGSGAEAGVVVDPHDTVG